MATPERATLAAVAGGGPGALASRRSAAWLGGAVDRPPLRPSVALPTGRRRLLVGVDVHAVGATSDPGRLVRGIPCTSIHRTLIDCAAAVPGAELTEMVDRAVARRLVAIPELWAAVEGADARRPGVAVLRAHLDRRGFAPAPPSSVLEAALDRLIVAAGLPEPDHEHDVIVDGQPRRLDRAWPHLRLAVEADGFAYHANPEQMADDRRRRNGLVRAGWTHLSFTWTQVTGRPGEVVAELRATYTHAEAGIGA